MHIVKFEDVELHVDNNGTLSTVEVAKGYGVTQQAIRTQKLRHSDEILKNIHYIEVWDDKFKRYVTRWTLEGVHMLGFFIKSERAKEFRKFTAKLLTEIKKGNAKVVAAGCKADQFITPQIMAYKANLSKKNKQIEELRWELAAAHNKIKELEAKNDPKIWLMEHNLLDLAGSLSRQNQELQDFAMQLELIARALKERAKTTQFFLDQIIKHHPKAKENVERIKKRFRRPYG